MLVFKGRKGVEFCDGLTRRDFLRAGALSAGAVGLSLADLAAGPRAAAGDGNCILLFLVGGPSHLDTWDLKPDAPSHIRGPFQPIRTRVAGVYISEIFPRMAAIADRIAFVRSVYHQEPPVHETGHQLMQTGRLCREGIEFPHFGAAVSRLHAGRAGGLPANVTLPYPIGNTGVSVSHGQSAGFLDPAHQGLVVDGRDGDLDPARPSSRAAWRKAIDAAHRDYDARCAAAGLSPTFDALFQPRTKKALDYFAEPESVRASYGINTFGQSCLIARRLIEHGVRFVTVNMFDTVFNKVTWDCHADGAALAANLDDYRNILGPMLDQAYTALLLDLEARGLLANTMVVAMGEFGRTPNLNPRGGRDHWPGAWTVLFAGGRIRGGQVVGATDKHGGEPVDRPVHASEIAASVYHGIGIDPRRRFDLPGGDTARLVDANPVYELF